MINIVFGIDSKYAKYCSVTVASILSNHKLNSKEDTIKFYFLSPEDNSISEKDRKQILELKKIQNFDYEFINIAMDEYKGLPYDRKITKAAYNRLLIPKILNHNIEKVIYLDSDLIVIDDILKLWNYDITNYLLAAVKDYERTNSNISYFNSGVLILNLKELRTFDFYCKWKNYIKDLSDIKSLKYFDQDILNYITEGKVLLIPKEFNAMAVYAVNNPKVVIAHFTSFKPWDAFCIHPMQNLYWEYVKQTGYEIKKQTVFAYLISFLKKEPFFLFKKKYWELTYNLLKDKLKIIFGKNKA